jgi:hypothetical protein
MNDNVIMSDSAVQAIVSSASLINVTLLRERLPELTNLCILAKSTTESYTKALKQVATMAGCETGSLRRYVSARVHGRVEEEQRRVEQLELLFTGV